MPDSNGEYVPIHEQTTEIVYKNPKTGQPLPGSTPQEINPPVKFTHPMQLPAIPKTDKIHPQSLPAINPPR